MLNGISLVFLHCQKLKVKHTRFSKLQLKLSHVNQIYETVNSSQYHYKLQFFFKGLLFNYSLKKRQILSSILKP